MVAAALTSVATVIGLHSNNFHNEKYKQAGAELGQAQLKLGLDCNQI